MKRCTKCRKELPETEFSLRGKSKTTLMASCKICTIKYRHAYSKQHYLDNRDAYLKRVYARRTALKTHNRQQMREYLKDKACEDCGETDIRTFDFDHIDPSLKSFEIGRANSMGIKWETILGEIQRCRIVCANCHRRRTAEQYGWWKQAA